MQDALREGQAAVPLCCGVSDGDGAVVWRRIAIAAEVYTWLANELSAANFLAS